MHFATTVQINQFANPYEYTETVLPSQKHLSVSNHLKISSCCLHYESGHSFDFYIYYLCIYFIYLFIYL